MGENKRSSENNVDYMVEMTNEEYRIELQKMFNGVEDNRMLRYFYISSLKKIQQEKAVDYQVSNSDYGELIFEIVHNTDNQEYLHFIYDLLISFKKKWGI